MESFDGLSAVCPPSVREAVGPPAQPVLPAPSELALAQLDAQRARLAGQCTGLGAIPGPRRAVAELAHRLRGDGPGVNPA